MYSLVSLLQKIVQDWMMMFDFFRIHLGQRCKGGEETERALRLILICSVGETGVRFEMI